MLDRKGLLQQTYKLFREHKNLGEELGGSATQTELRGLLPCPLGLQARSQRAK